MFKQLTNVRPQGDSKPEVVTTPTSGTIKLNSAGAAHAKVGNGDYVSVIQDDDKDSEWNGIYLVKGHEGDEKEPQFGSKLSTASGKNTAGALSFSSENAYNALEGNADKRMVYSIGEPKTHPDFKTPLYKLTFVRDEAKLKRKPKKA
jgi:hypothetical protein